MSPKLAVLATAFVFVGGCAQTGEIKPITEPYEGYPAGGSASSGASGAGQQAAGTGQRSRAEVRAEAVEAVKNYKSTLMEEQEWFNPFVKHQR